MLRKISGAQRLAKAEREIVVGNRHGLHARPAMQLVDLAHRFRSDITLTKPPGQGEERATVADAKSVMAVITLAATPGTRLQLRAEGDDAQEAVAEIGRLFDEHFGEDD